MKFDFELSYWRIALQNELTFTEKKLKFFKSHYNYMHFECTCVCGLRLNVLIWTTYWQEPAFYACFTTQRSFNTNYLFVACILINLSNAFFFSDAESMLHLLSFKIVWVRWYSILCVKEEEESNHLVALVSSLIDTPWSMDLD